jgi:HJR/Mrr/RecB family endonuclease
LSEFIGQSAKLTTTIDILENIKKRGEKAIIFANRRDTCKMLHKVICKKFNLDMNDIYIVNGDMPGFANREKSMKISRQRAIDKFESKDGFNVIIMSPLAAGVGLNITKANHVIHYSRWWNPAKEDQATDRVYRIGQVLPVHIYFPIGTCYSFKTFDVLLHELLERKRALMYSTLFPTEQAEVTPDEVFEGIVSSIPDSDIPERTPIKMSDILSFEPSVFEAVVAAIFQCLGKKVLLTPEQNDKGVDIVVMPDIGEEVGLLIQVKHTGTGRKVGSSAIREVFLGKGFYENKLNIRFECAAITNTDFTSEAMQLASASNVKLMDSRWLEINLLKTKVYHSQVRQLLFQRIERI